MARLLNEKAIKERIKANTFTMISSRKAIYNTLRDFYGTTVNTHKVTVYGVVNVRTNLSIFLKCGKAIMQDKEKLKLIKQNKGK